MFFHLKPFVLLSELKKRKLGLDQNCADGQFWSGPSLPCCWASSCTATFKKYSALVSDLMQPLPCRYMNACVWRMANNHMNEGNPSCPLLVPGFGRRERGPSWLRPDRRRRPFRRPDSYQGPESASRPEDWHPVSDVNGKVCATNDQTSQHIASAWPLRAALAHRNDLWATTNTASLKGAPHGSTARLSDSQSRCRPPR